jgi:signal transduction histidine kinase
VIDECLATGRPIVRRALELPRPSAAPLHFGVTASPLFDDSGEVHGAVCLFSDLTDVVALEEQLRLKDSLARLGELTAGLAHEFRNGLSTIHGYARLVDLDQLPPSYRPYVEGIRQETDALGEVVTNFLAFARPTELVLGPVDLRAVVARVVSEVRADVEGRGGSLSVSGEFGIVEGDDVLLRQAIGNLLRNAAEAATAAAVPPRIAVESSVDVGQHVARLAVHDNGPGVDPSMADRIFTPFFSTKGRGTGLGLALVQKIVVTHNGRIAVGVSPLGGAVFQLTLPLRAPG